MSQFELSKPADEVEIPQAMPNGLYAMRLVEPAERKPNKAMQNDPSDPKAGMNIVLQFETFGETDPSLNGRQFTIWLSEPKPGDRDRRTRRGQTIEDWKIQNIIATAQTLGGGVNGSSVDIPDGALCRAQIVQKLGEDGVTIFNEISGNLLPY